MVRTLILISMFFVLACNKGSDPEDGGSEDQGPVEPGKPVSLAKVVSVSLGIYHACAVDDQNHVACWLHPQKFIPSSPGSSRGSFEVDYPSKTNADLAGQQFSYIAGIDEYVCAVRTDGKVLCFSPSDPSKKNISDLATLGRFKKVALVIGKVCAIDIGDNLTCHTVDFGPSGPDDLNTAEEIIDFARGQYDLGNVYRNSGCYITANNMLTCAAIDDYPEAPPAKVLASSFKSGSSESFSLATLSPDKKVLKFFGLNRKMAIQDVDTLDISQTYNDIALSVSAVCLVVASSNEVKCQHEKQPKSPKKTNDDLKSELINKVSVGMNTICGLRLDKTAFCWQGKGFQPDVPKNIKAE